MSTVQISISEHVYGDLEKLARDIGWSVDELIDRSIMLGSLEAAVLNKNGFLLVKPDGNGTKPIRIEHNK